MRTILSTSVPTHQYMLCHCLYYPLKITLFHCDILYIPALNSTLHCPYRAAQLPQFKISYAHNISLKLCNTFVICWCFQVFTRLPDKIQFTSSESLFKVCSSFPFFYAFSRAELHTLFLLVTSSLV